MSDLASPSRTAFPEPVQSWQGSSNGNGRFSDLRSVQWRINLGILPSSPSSSSVDDLRRVTADFRRRYANLRRRLLVDPHALNDRSDTPNILIDNPLSQNPDSTWGRFFRNAELEKMVDQDLSRLYPEPGSYFQTPGCQGMLRRVLLLWCLRNPEYGYRQGMHELLAPLLYVLHVDIERLSEVRKLHEDQFFDRFDDESFEEIDNKYHFNFKRFTDSTEPEAGSQGSATKIRSVINELDPNVKKIVLLGDAYGAEGELGIVLSDKFMEHDAFSMFDALMSGSNGFVAMADFFSHSPLKGSWAGNGMAPVIEASTAVYHLLSSIDPSLHSHLTELGVEPQYFALRWFRVLFGREFVLGNLLLIWDEIFMSDNTKLQNDSSEENAESTFKILGSPRGAFIAAIAVSMILQLRSSLLATEHATSCLQKLLNFPEGIDLKKLTAKAKLLQELALDTKVRSSSCSAPPPEIHALFGRSKSTVVRSHTIYVSDSVPPRTPMSLVRESYWEEKWRDLNKYESNPSSSSGKGGTVAKKKGWSQRLRLNFSRREADSAPAMAEGGSQEIDSVKKEKEKDGCCVEVGAEKHDDIQKDFVYLAKDEGSFSGIAGNEEISSIFPDLPSPPNGDIDPGGTETEKSSVSSNESADENEDSPPLSNNKDASLNDDYCGKAMAGPKEKKLLSGKFTWLRKRNIARPVEIIVSGKEGANEEASRSTEKEKNSFVGNDSCNPSPHSLSSKGDSVDPKVMDTLKNLGESMLEHIQVIESVFEQDEGRTTDSLENLQKSVVVGKGQATATVAFEELRKISSLLSEM